MAIDPVTAVHASAAAQKIEAVNNAPRNPNPQNQPTVPQDKLTISAAAQAKQSSPVPAANAQPTKAQPTNAQPKTRK